MDSTMSRRGLLGLLGAGALAATVAAVEPAEAASPITRWNRTTIYVENRLGSAWPVATAAAAWSKPSKLDLRVVSKAPLGTSRIVIKWGRLPRGVLGQAGMARDGLRRYKYAEITISDTISRSYDTFRKVLLLRHELGHTLGFAHSRKADVMNEKITPDGCWLLSSYHMRTLQQEYGR